MAANIPANMLITGAGGFIGRALVPFLEQQGHTVTRWPGANPIFDLRNATAFSEWVAQLRGIDVLVHLAAHVHQLKPSPTSDALMQCINREGTLRLAEAAVQAGVKRFVFISTAKVFGEGEHGPYHVASDANPADAYALSKWEAEKDLRKLAAHSAFELVIIRPPLVYGPGVGANFARLQQLAWLPLPLPLKNIRNRRDMIGIDNLIDFIALCARHPAAAGGIWLCTDGLAYSLADVVGTLRRARQRRAGLFAVPGLPQILKRILGAATARRLFGNFELDMTATRATLQWSPTQSMLAIMRESRR